MANAITLPIYGINSDQKFTTMKQLGFPGPGLFLQPVAAPYNNINGNLIYAQVNSTATGDTAFYTSLTVSAIITLCNA